MDFLPSVIVDISVAVLDHQLSLVGWFGMFLCKRILDKRGQGDAMDWQQVLE